MITQILIAVTLIPSLVCAMPACVGPMEVAQAKTSGQHCIDAGQATADQVMLLADCMEVDLQQALHPAQAPQPVSDAGLEASATVEFWAAINADIVTRQPIRAPPARWPGPDSEQPVYLSTRRLRI